ncbi:aldo/keto reductase, partial [Pseudomonas sp.]
LGLGVVTWSPLGGGMLTGKYRKGESGRAEGFGGKVFQPENSAQRTQILDTVLEVAGELGVSAGQVAIAWAGSHGAVPIIGPRSHEQIADNLGALSLTLTDEQLQRLDAVSSLDPSAGPRSAADWSDETRARGVA